MLTRVNLLSGGASIEHMSLRQNAIAYEEPTEGASNPVPLHVSVCKTVPKPTITVCKTFHTYVSLYTLYVVVWVMNGQYLSSNN